MTATKTIKPGKKRAPLDALGFTAAAALMPDAYADIPNTLIDTLKNGAKYLGYALAATLFGATCKVVASVDGTAFVDLTTQDGVGVNRTIDIVVAVGTTVHATISPATPAGSAGLGFRYYKVQGKNTVAASVASVIVSISGKQ